MEWVHGRQQRLPGFVILTLIVTLMTLCSLAVAGAQSGAQQAAQGMISLDVVDADLSQVVRILMSESKQSIVIGDPDAKQKKVTAMLNNVPLETALRYVVESVGCTWRRDSDGVYLIRPKTAAEAAAPAVAPADDAAIATPRTADGRLESRRYNTRVETIKLYNTSPTEMMWILGVYRLEDTVRAETQQQSQTPSPGVYVQRPDGSLQPLMDPQQTPPMSESLKGTPGVAPRVPQIGMDAMQMPPSPPNQGRSGQYPYRPGGPGAPGQTPAPGGQQGSGLLPQGIDYVLTYDLDNSLIVRGDDEGIEELKTIISKLDVAPRQIMIEAKFVSIATTGLESLGINWSLERLNTSFQTQFSPAGNILVGYANGNLMANLRTQLSRSHGQLVNAPIITTMNNLPASIGFQTTIPYLSSTTVFNQTGSSSASTTYFLPVTSQLWVLPRINNADNSITVQIMPQISDVGENVQTQNGTVPIVNSQYVQTTRRVANGETIVLGGLIRKDDKSTVDKIPLLGDLPIIGPLFRSTQKNLKDNELLIFLTPTIVPERPVAGGGVGVMP